MWRGLWLLLLAVCAANAFKNTSPFFLLSSDPLRTDAKLRSTTTAESQTVQDQVLESLNACDRKWYYIFTQAGVSERDFQGPKAMPRLQKAVAGLEATRAISIPNVRSSSGFSAAEGLKDGLEMLCKAAGKKGTDAWPEGDNEYRIIEMSMESLPTDEEMRAKIMRDTDDGIADTVKSVVEGKWPSVLIYVTSPSSPLDGLLDQSLYEMDEPYPSPLRTDLKRDLKVQRRQSENTNDDFQAGLPIFERYQFLTPALFMSLAVSLILIMLLYVGVSAIAGLEVSYAAFNKEMGPQAQNKGKQQ